MFTYNIPNPNSISSTADWVELYITYQNCGLSRTQLGSFLESSKGKESSDDFIKDVWNELDYRRKMYGISPPFDIDYNYIQCIVEWQKAPEYLACLIFSLEGNPNTTVSSAAVAGKYFERISNEAVKSYIKGNSIIYGFPNDQNIEEISNNFLFEKFNYIPPTYRKDRNLDLIAWKSWGDNRASQLILFVQCAAGNNWKTKTKELNLRAWEKYIHVASKLIKGFSIPIVISNSEELHEVSTDAGIVIDRLRIYRETINLVFDDLSLKSDLITWCNNRISEIVS
ncbi:MAG: hypothetical protein IPJ22_03045 [Bacteroidetes bacterium]|jgi:hypothetical protein|nr:hypothetical protein [Bacteroidota bacterium]